MDMNKFNVSATLNIFRLIVKPTLCLPHATISTFDRLPIPLTAPAFGKKYEGRKVDIRAVVLDKDNCFARPGENEVYGPYEKHLQTLRHHYPGRKLLIVSNSTGTTSLDPSLADARALTKATGGIHVLPHRTKKPGCGPDIMEYFARYPETGVTRPEHVAVVGDRLSTDVLMANLMGGWGVWVRDGVVREDGLLVRMEKRLAGFLVRRGYEAPEPRSQFDD